MAGEGQKDRKCGVKDCSGIPTVKECEEFNRKANAWLRKRGLRTGGVDRINFGKEDDRASSE